MKLDLTSKAAVVTGGAGQLGKAIVRSLAACGANVAICYFQSREAAHELQAEVIGRYSVKASAIYADVTDLQSVLEMKAQVNKELGIAGIIVNNAVSHREWKPVLEQDIAAYEDQFKSSVLQNVAMAKAFVPDMVKQNYGRVIAISTECVLQNFETQSAYVAGKRGMDAVLRVLAREVGPHNITVNQVAPGWIITERSPSREGLEKNTGQNFPYVERVPMRRRGTDSDVANAVCFLASDLAAFITGVCLPVCGGNVMP